MWMYWDNIKGMNYEKDLRGGSYCIDVWVGDC